MPFLPLFTGIRHLAHVLTVPLTKACLLCATPAGLDLYIQAMSVGTYRVQSPGFPKIVYYLDNNMSTGYTDTITGLKKLKQQQQQQNTTKKQKQNKTKNRKKNKQTAALFVVAETTM